jgi:ABC-type branched-subunit amino acid transport system substrate-binding protein
MKRLAVTMIWLTFLLPIAQGVLPRRVICSHPLYYSSSSSLVSELLVSNFAVEQHFPTLFSGFQWEFRLLGSGAPTAQNMVLSWAINGTGCDALMGPGISALAVSVSPVVDRLWLDFASTSIQLSDKSLYSAFSRVIPTDAITASVLAYSLQRFGWLEVNVLYVQTSYGQSFAAAFQDAMRSVRGSIPSSSSIPAAASIEVVKAALLQLATSPSRALLLSMDPLDDVFPFVVEALEQLNLRTSFWFILSDAFCGSLKPAVAQAFPGALCAAYAVNRSGSIVQDFETAFRVRNVSTESTKFASAIGPTESSNWFANSSNVPLSLTGSDAAFALDSAYLLMFILNHSNPATETAAALRASMRLFQGPATGATGNIQLSTATGDRLIAAATVFNFNAAGAMIPMFSVWNSTVTPLPSLVSPGLYLVDGNLYPLSSIPTPVKPVAPDGNGLLIPTNTLIGILMGSIAFSALGFFAWEAYYSPRFTELVRSGLWIVCVQVLTLGGSMVLQTASMLTVMFNPNYSAIFIILYIVLTSASLAVHAVEVLVLLMFFVRNVRADNDLPEDEIIAWEFRVAQVHLFGIGVRDAPLIAMSFAAMIQEEVTLLLLGSFCLACVFAGMKYSELKSRIAKFMNAPSTQAAKIVGEEAVQSLHKSTFLPNGTPATGVTSSVDKGASSVCSDGLFAGGALVNALFGASQTVRRALNSQSTPDEIARVRKLLWTNEDNEERLRALKRMMRGTVRQLEDRGVTRDEVFAIIKPYLNQRFDKESAL